MLGKTNCDATLLSQSDFLGIPIAGWGLVYFGGQASLLFLGYLSGQPFTRRALIGALVACAGGIGVSVYLSTLMFRHIVPICPLCAITHAFNLALFVLIYLGIGAGPKAIFATIGSGVNYVVRGRSTESAENHGLTLLVFFASALVALASYEWALVQFERAANDAATNPRSDQILKAYLLIPRMNLAISPEDPRLGAADAPIQIVVFSDFQCAGCKLFAARAQTLTKEFSTFISIVYKHFPLDRACNAAIKQSVHDVACRAAFDSEAARRSGKFWEFHDAVYALNESLSADALEKIDRTLGLPASDDASRQNDSLRIRRDIENALQVGVDSTPAVFINGRRVSEPSMRALEIIATYNLGVWMETNRR